MDNIVNANLEARAIVNEKILTSLIDTILDNAKLNNANIDLLLSYQAEDSILLIVKTFFNEEYMNRLIELQKEDGEE